MVEKSKLVPIPIAVAGVLDENENDLYLPGADGKPPVLYRAASRGLSDPDYYQLSESGLSHLFVRGEALGRCEEALETNLNELLHDPRIEPAQKATCVQHVGI